MDNYIKTAPDYENPNDSNDDNIYIFTELPLMRAITALLKI